MKCELNSPEDLGARRFVADYYQATALHWECPTVRSAFEGVFHAVWMNNVYRSPFFNPDATIDLEKDLFRHSAGLGFAVGCLDACVEDILDFEDSCPGSQVPVTAEMEEHAEEWMRSGVVNFRHISDALAPADTMGLLVVNFSHGYVGGVGFIDRLLAP